MIEDIQADFIPAKYYDARQTHLLETDLMWPKVWQQAARVEEVPEVGDYVVYDIIDESVIIVRTKPDEIKAFYNVCQHRGRQLVNDRRGRVTQFTCAFHGWRYQLDGSLAYVHRQEDWEGCPNTEFGSIGLKPVDVDFWGGWVWINMDPQAESLRSYLGDAFDILAPFEFEAQRFTWYETIIAPVNWKVVLEAFMEAYHATATHSANFTYSGKSKSYVFGRHAMFQSAGPDQMLVRQPSGKWFNAKSPADRILQSARYQHQALKALTLEPALAAAERVKAEASTETSFEKAGELRTRFHKEEFAKRGIEWPEALTPEALNRAGTAWHIFPNFVMLPTIDGNLCYRARPCGDDEKTSIFDIWCLGRYAPGDEPEVSQNVSHGFEEFRGRNPFLEEDFDNMIAVDKGQRSRGFAGARTNPVQERIVVNFKRTLRGYIEAGSADGARRDRNAG